MWFRALVTPDGFRYNQLLGKTIEDYNKIATAQTIINTTSYGDDMYNNEYFQRAEIVFIFRNERSSSRRDFDNLKSIAKELTSDNPETKNLVGERIFDLIRSTENEYLDILLELDVEDGREFNIKYGTNIEGALKALTSASSWRLVKSAQKNYVKMLKDDPRFDNLSDEEKEKAVKKAREKARKAKDKDAQKILQWIERLEQELGRRNKYSEEDGNEGGLDDIFNELGEE